MSERALNVGVVGCGMMAAGTHIPLIAANAGLKLRWLCDLDVPRAKGLADRHGAAHVTADYRDVLNDPAVDFVVLATTHSLRGEFIQAAARKGKGVYVEKPMGSTPAEIAGILKAVRQSGIPLCVGHNRRSAPAVRAAMDVLDRWRAHPQIVPWRLDRNSHLRPPLAEEEQTLALLRVNDDILTWKPWAFGEGIILGEMTHFLDLANLFVARVPRRVMTMGSATTNATILVQYDDGSLATIVQSGLGTLDYPKELFEITHKGAMIALDHLVEMRVMGIPNVPFRSTFPPREPRDFDAPGIEGFYRAAERTIAERLKTGSNELFIGMPDKGHARHLDLFARCVRGEGPSPCSAEEGAKATILTLKAMESCKLGRPVDVSEGEWLAE